MKRDSGKPPGRLHDTAVRLESVTKVYGKGARAVTAIDDVSVAFPQGTFSAVMGPSGSGKSTFLQCAAGLDQPTSGSVRLGAAGTDLSALPEARLTELRRDRIGFVFQAFNLLAALNVQQNITLPLRLAGRRADPAQLAEILSRVGLSGRARHRPSQLSGGEQQRVALARALITRPEVVFADEPTGALDTVAAGEVLKLLRHTVDGLGQTVVMVTHDPVAASYADSVLFLVKGRIAEVAAGLSAGEIAARVARVGVWA
jgi:putative ABC transport system ATP-binding protein